MKTIDHIGRISEADLAAAIFRELQRQREKDPKLLYVDDNHGWSRTHVAGDVDLYSLSRAVLSEMVRAGILTKAGAVDAV
jgi:hypothetical protein